MCLICGRVSVPSGWPGKGRSPMPCPPGLPAAEVKPVTPRVARHRNPNSGSGRGVMGWHECSSGIGGCGGVPQARLSRERRQSSPGEVLVRTRLLVIAAVVLAATGTATGATAASPAAASGPCGTASVPHTYQHVIWIWMENHSFSDIIGNTSQAPYINALAAGCGLATNYHNTTHPSLPNYLAATSGLAQGSLPATTYLDCSPSVICDMTVGSIFGQGETWKAYQESMPSNCDTSDSGEYVVSHNPAPYYTSLPGCASHDVPYTQLATDLAGNALPAFSFITPNLIDDMHDGTVADGDNWLAANLPPIF